MTARSRFSALAAGLAAAALAASSASAAEPQAGHGWSAAWAAAPFGVLQKDIAKHTRIYDNQTVRQVLRSGLAGQRIRIRLSNDVGPNRVRVGAVRVALSDVNGVTRPGTDRLVTFGGRSAFVMPTGAPMLSDPIDLPVGRFDEVAVSVFYPERTEAAAHRLQVTLSAPGDHTAEAVLPGASTTYGAALASELEVEAPAKRVIVAFGDSITEGAASTPKAHKSWPEQLANLLGQDPQRRDWVVINEGISGNRVLHDGAGPNGLARFQRDALDTPGATDIVLLEGINDIGWGHGRPGEEADAEQLIGAYQQMIAQAHARGLRIYAGTLLPFKGAIYYSVIGEADRQAVNRWIRTSGAFDGVVDFEALMKDPADPLKMPKALQHGDDLHPDDAGYGVMAKAAYEQLFGGAAR